LVDEMFRWGRSGGRSGRNHMKYYPFFQPRSQEGSMSIPGKYRLC